MPPAAPSSAPPAAPDPELARRAYEAGYLGSNPVERYQRDMARGAAPTNMQPANLAANPVGTPSNPIGATTPVKSASIKLAANPMAGLVAGGAIRTARYTPALMKSLIALGVLGGAGTGALYWGANRHINEDSSADNEQLKTKIQEYDKIRRMMEQDIDNQKIRSADDLRTFARTY